MARHYDQLDRLYREIWGEDLHHGLWLDPGDSPERAVENLTALVAGKARLSRGDRVCDVGCGYGSLARSLAKGHGVRVTGLTVSGAQYRRARERATENDDLRFLHRSWLDNGLPDRHFDAVIAVESVSHVSDKAGFFQEAHRTLAPDGRLVVAAWLAGDDPGPLERRYLLEPICAEGRLPGLASRSEHEAWIGGAGFSDPTFQDVSDDVRRTWSVCLRRVAGRIVGDGEMLRYLLDRRATERAFGLSLARIWVAYRTGALRYGIFTARRP